MPERKRPQSRVLRRLRKYAKARTPRDWLLRVGKDLRPLTNAVIGRYSEIGDTPVLDPSTLPFVAELESHWKTIRAEAEEILAQRRLLPSVQDISPDHANIAGGPGWRSYFLYGYGYRRERACRRCPETARLVEGIPGLLSAFFSIMEPGQYLKPHRGPTKAIVTWHLPLIIPDPSDECRIVIDGTPYAWVPGQSLVFDDTALHEVWNRTQGERVVLLIHLRRPARFPGSLVARAFLGAIVRSPFVQDGRRNQDAWEDAFEARLAAQASGSEAS